MKRNTLTTAVLAGLTGMAGMVSVSNATGVHVNPEGTGQVLIYPFYTARGGNDTLISIVNTTERGKAVKVRFREALNSREVLDFHLYMSPYDVWTAAVTENSAGGATLFTADTSCTVPAIPSTGVDFLDFDFAQAAVVGGGSSSNPDFPGTLDGAATGIERTASGYIEVIEMGSMVDREKLTAPAKAADLKPGHIEWASKHGATGVPNSCATLVGAWTDYTGVPAASIPVAGGKWLVDPSFGLEDPTGGLFGAASVINVDAGTMFSFNAVALDNFWGADDGPAATVSSHSVPGEDAPNLASTTNTVSHVLSGGVMVEQEFDLGIQAVSAAIMRSSIANEYATDATIGAQTEWVVTFPTKSYHVDPYQQTAGHGGVAGAGVVAPFTAPWTKGATAAAFKPACESFSVEFWDREEQQPSAAPDAPGTPVPPVFSPIEFTPDPDPEKVSPDFTLCSEANVIGISGADTSISVGDTSSILGEPARAGGLGFVNFGLPYSSGWAEINLVEAFGTGVGGVEPLGNREMTVSNPQGNNFAVIQGLPVVGFAVTTYTNSDVSAGVLANYGGTFNHRGSRSITSS